METEKAVLVWNQETNKIYTANGKCSCRAFEQGQACKHRALARLLRTYFEATESKPVDLNNSPYLKLSGTKKPEFVGRIRIN